MTPNLAEGQMAPDFTLPAAGWSEATLTLSDLRGRLVVLYFYPRDNTPGCTTESQDFSGALPRLRDAGAEVFGLSTDTIASHDRFIAKQTLTVPLLSDVDAAVASAYDVWVQKSQYGRSFMGIERSTILIDGEGRVARIWPKVRVAGHVDAVLAEVERLSILR